mmetsp:Transcript_28922/g.76312  ORF Transcript_28922/g.76312 Transcript_28922/m.76312 type:complete len:279 (+) Transcript_28922:727-1563(+)
MIMHGAWQSCGQCPWRLMFHPCMIQSPDCVVPCLDTPVQKLADELLGILRDAFPIILIENELRGLNFCHYFEVSRSPKRRITAEKHVHDHAAGPHVTGLVIASRQHLWGDVEGRAQSCPHGFAFGKPAREPKVDDLNNALINRSLVLEKEILRLEIPVTDLDLMHIADAPDNLLHHVRSLPLSETLSCLDGIEEFASLTELHHKVHHVLVFETLIQLDNVGMVHRFHDVNLSACHLRFLRFLGDALDGSHLIAVLRLGASDRTEATRPDFPTLHLIVV